MIALRRITLVVFGVLGSSIFGSNLLASATPGRIIGDNDLVQVPASYANDPRVQSIGKLKVGCTATHLGNGIAITAGHCFARSNFAGVRENLPCSEAKYSVRWGVTYGSEGYLTSQCTAVVAMELNSERDYAIFRVSPIPPSSIPISLEKVNMGDDISIFSHPRMRPLEWSQWCKVEGFVQKSHGNQFYYSCDTEGGSSGAGVLDKDYKFVGIHNYYNAHLNRNGATLLSVTPIANILRAEQTRSVLGSEAGLVALPLLRSKAPLLFSTAFPAVEAR